MARDPLVWLIIRAMGIAGVVSAVIAWFTYEESD